MHPTFPLFACRALRASQVKQQVLDALEALNQDPTWNHPARGLDPATITWSIPLPALLNITCFGPPPHVSQVPTRKGLETAFSVVCTHTW
jgi:hypothetical protein